MSAGHIKAIQARKEAILEAISLAANISDEETFSEKVKTLKKSLKHLSVLQDLAQSVQQVTLSQIGTNPASHETTQQPSIIGNLPEFQTGSTRSLDDIEQFLRTFTTILVVNHVPQAGWYRTLLSVCASDVVIWLSNHVNLNSTWQEIETLLKQQYLTTSREDRLRALFGLKWQSGETLGSFLKRFQEAAVKVECESNAAEIRHLLIMKLPYDLRSRIYDVSTFRSFASLKELCQVLLGMESFRAFDRVSSTPFKAIPFCRTCQRKGHEEKDCRSASKLPIMPSVAKPRQTEDRRLRNLTTVYEPQDNLAENPNSISDNSDIYLASIKLDASKHKNDFIVKIKLNGMGTEALLDTGASHSFISPKLVSKLQVKTLPAVGKIQMGSARLFEKRIGLTEPLNLEYNGRTVTQTFELLELKDDTPCIIGADLLSILNFSLENKKIIPSPVEYLVRTFTTTREEENDFLHDATDRIQTLKSHPNHDNLISQIQDVLSQNSNIPSDSFCNLKEAIVELDTGSHSPVYRKSYSTPQKCHTAVEQTIQQWLRNGIIEHCNGSPWHSPLLVVPKKDELGGITLKRVCIDPRHINELLPTAPFPMPTTREIFEMMGDCTIFSVLDLMHSFHQLPIKPEDRCKTAFSWNGFLYQFVGAPFGLKSLTFTFQRVMSRLLQNVNFALVYVDDIIIFSKDPQSHVEHVKHVINLLTQANLRLQPSKCHLSPSCSAGNVPA